jgi:hypothetical protein
MMIKRIVILLTLFCATLIGAETMRIDTINVGGESFEVRYELVLKVDTVHICDYGLRRNYLDSLDYGDDAGVDSSDFDTTPYYYYIEAGDTFICPRDLKNTELDDTLQSHIEIILDSIAREMY